jgi:thiamine pyrophosphokinase
LKAVILAGAAVTATPELRSELAGAELVIAADGGLRHAAALGLSPAFLIGDFDSVTPADLEPYPEITKLRYPVDKAELDLELAISLALREGAGELVIVGASSGRLDQTLAALLVAARWQQQLPVVLLDGSTSVWPLASGDTLELQLAPGMPFSVLSLQGDSVISLRGAAWPLDHARLEFGSGRGVSNNASLAGNSPVCVTLHSGLAVVIAGSDDG